MSSKPETNLSKRVKKALLARFPGILVTKIHGGPYQEAGVSDMLCCYEGRYIAIEHKVGNNTPTLLQLDFLERVEKAGGIGGVSYSVEESVQIVEKAVQFAENLLDKGKPIDYNKHTFKKKEDTQMAKKDQKIKTKKQEALEEEDEDDLELEDLELEEYEDDEEEEGVDYSELSLKELKALCKDRGIEFGKKADEEDLITLLEEDDEGEEEEEDEEPEPPKKSSKKADLKKAPAKADKKASKNDDAKHKPAFQEDVPEGALTTKEVAAMCGVEARILRQVLRKEFRPENGNRRYFWMPGDKELKAILDHFGKSLPVADKADKKKPKK